MLYLITQLSEAIPAQHCDTMLSDAVTGSMRYVRLFVCPSRPFLLFDAATAPESQINPQRYTSSRHVATTLAFMVAVTNSRHRKLCVEGAVGGGCGNQ